MRDRRSGRFAPIIVAPAELGAPRKRTLRSTSFLDVGGNGSNPFARSSSRSRKLSPRFSGPSKSPTTAKVCAVGLGVRYENIMMNLSPAAHFSREFGVGRLTLQALWYRLQRVGPVLTA